MVAIIKPPIAGPAEKPKFIASLINVTDRVLFSGLLYTLIATYIAGLNESATAMTKNIPTHIWAKVSRNCKAINKNPVANKLLTMTL